MPLPKGKVAKTRTRNRRSHHRLKVPHVVDCPRCKSPRLAHTACAICGTYRGREAITMPEPDLNE